MTGAEVVAEFVGQHEAAETEAGVHVVLRAEGSEEIRHPAPPFVVFDDQRPGIGARRLHDLLGLVHVAVVGVRELVEVTALDGIVVVDLPEVDDADPGGRKGVLEAGVGLKHPELAQRLDDERAAGSKNGVLGVEDREVDRGRTAATGAQGPQLRVVAGEASGHRLIEESPRIGKRVGAAGRERIPRGASAQGKIIIGHRLDQHGEPGSFRESPPGAVSGVKRGGDRTIAKHELRMSLTAIDLLEDQRHATMAQNAPGVDGHRQDFGTLGETGARWCESQGRPEAKTIDELGIEPGCFEPDDVSRPDPWTERDRARRSRRRAPPEPEHDDR